MMAEKPTFPNGKWANRIVGIGEEQPDQLLANPMNFRIHSGIQQAALEGSLDTLGWIQQVLVNRTTNTVIDGHLRVALALRHHQPLVPVLYVDLTEDEERQALLSLDPVAAMAATDRDKLAALLQSVQSDDQRVLAMMKEIAERERIPFGEQPPEDPGAQMDRAEELREKWGVESGQLWEVGKHRIICGDCTDRAVVERVMMGKKADLCLTDPPYNVGFDYGETGRDNRSEKEYAAFSRLWFALSKDISMAILFTPGTGRGPGHPNLQMWFEIEWPYWIIAWIKKNALVHSSLGGFNNWEPVLLYGKPNKKIPQDIYDIPITVQSDVADDDGNKLHPVPKQVSFYSALISDFTNSNQLIFDPFLGSGTSLIACERLGRIGRGVEISPAYVAVSLQRLADMGLEPKLVET